MKKPFTRPSEYEQKAIDELNEMRQPHKKENKFAQKVLKSLSKPINIAGEWAAKIPGIDTVKTKTEDALAAFAHNLTDWTVKKEETIKRYFDAGYSDIKTRKDIALLDLKDVEQAIGDLCKKYQTLAHKDEKEESSTALSLPSMPSDIIALVSMNHKAISEYATMYGFDISQYHERIFALNILEYAACTDEASKKQVMGRLVEQTKKMAKKDIDQIEKPKFLQLFTKLTSSITFQLLKAKVGQVVSIKGAVIGTGFNAYFTTEVCDVANTLYKQRFLAEKYGHEIINLDDDEEEKNEDKE